jgi:formyl-CoA transferase/CoA:oxalate CoA-transferase
MVVTVEHPKAGTLRVTGVPLKLSATPGAVTLPPPLLGEHNTQVLTEWLHLSATDVERLRQAGAL